MGNSFAERTKQFWEWFGMNEPRLDTLLQQANPELASEELIETFRQGLSLLANDLSFNVGGDHEFSFAVNIDNAQFFLLPYVVANMPEQFRDKWTFHPWMQPAREKDLSIRMHGVEVSSDNVMVQVYKNEDGMLADMRFFAKELKRLKDDQAYEIFYTLAGSIIGEALGACCIGIVKRARSLKRDMIPLTQLEDWLRSHLCENGELPSPADSGSVYTMIPSEGKPRMDIITGYTHHVPLIEGYYGGDSAAYDRFVEFGAKPAFLYYSHIETVNSLDPALGERNTLMEKLDAEILGASGSGQEIGLLMGAALGESCAYIDLLLYDEQAFLERAKAFFTGFPRSVIYKEYVDGGEELVLC